MSVPLKFAPGDSCEVGGQRGIVRALTGGLATVELENGVHDVPIGDLDISLPKLGPAPFQVVVADPPWSFKDRLPGRGRGAAKHYSTLSVEDICRLDLPCIGSDALLFLWRVAALQEEALRVVRAWGFRLVSELVWVKLGSNGRPRIGMGRYVRAAHEVCLVATRGDGKACIKDRSVPSVFMAPRTSHSTKPAAFFDIVERLASGPRVELFARAERVGWTCFGDAIGSPLALREDA